MSIINKVKAVEKLFNSLQNEVNQFQSETKLHCNLACGNCCNKADINASPLEFLPWAFHIFLSGKVDQVLESLENKESSHCLLFKQLSISPSVNGRCDNYAYRGLICRLFGYAAVKDKYGQLKLASCKIIKTEQEHHYLQAQAAISEGLYVPVYSDYYMKLNRIDLALGSKIVPINEALKIALEEVLQYYAYRPFPKKYKITA